MAKSLAELEAEHQPRSRKAELIDRGVRVAPDTSAVPLVRIDPGMVEFGKLTLLEASRAPGLDTVVAEGLRALAFSQERLVNLIVVRQ